MLDNAQILDLVEKAQNGDQDAKEVLLKENSPLIKCLIKRFKDKGIEYDDLYQIGCMGFLKALNNFKIDYNVKFSTYVVPMVIGEIKRFMRDDGAIKVSRVLKSLNLQINKYIEQFYGEKQRNPSIEEIAEHFKVDQQEVVLAMDSSRMPVSLYSPLDDGEDLMLVDRVGGQDQSRDMFENLALKDILHKLDKRDQKIILLRFYYDKTQSEIAKQLKISQVQVSRLENRILENLRKKLI